MKKNINGEQIEVHEVEPISSIENWNQYQLPNGDLLKIKFVISAIYTTLDKKNPDGSTIYSFDYTPVIKVISQK
jgi:hypothetical protein